MENLQGCGIQKARFHKILCHTLVLQQLGIRGQNFQIRIVVAPLNVQLE